VALSATAPTVSALSNDTNIATTAWVTNHAGGGYMTLATTQSASGQKTFSNANTFISGNLVTNSIQSSVTTNDINIGTQLTTGDINLGNSGGGTNVALNWGSTSNSGQLTFRGGSFSLLSSGINSLECGASFAMNIATNQTSGILSLGTATGRTAATNICTGSTTGTTITIGSTGGGTTTLNCGTLNLSGTSNSRLGANMTAGTITIGGGALSATAINIGSTQTDVTSAINIGTVVTGNAPITIGSTASTTQTATHNAITTFSKAVTINGTLTMGTANQILTNLQEGTTALTSVLLYSENARSGSIGLGTGTTGKTITIGENTATTLNLRGSTIDANILNVSGTLTMGTANQILTNLQDGTTALTSVLLYSENARSGSIGLGTGTTGKTITIGENTATTLNLRGSTIDASKLNVSGTLTASTLSLTTLTTNTINGTAVGTGVNLYDEATRTGTINFGTGGSAKNLNIGGTNTSTTFFGTGFIVPVLQVNGIASFKGTTQFGDAGADDIIPNGTLTKPWIIGYGTTSSFSLSSVTPVTTYLGGTLQTSNSFSASPTGTFRYVMASITPYDANGGLSLSAGTYMLWIGINFEDGSTFNMTDLRLGLSLVSTLTTASSEAVIVASLPNLTCYFHKTDAGDAAASDSENRVLSSCFNLASAGIVYPFYDANHSVTMDTVKVDVIITKIGSA
jgi:hypothetical protein